MTTINEAKPIPVVITITVTTTVKANPSMTDLANVTAKADDLKKIAAEHGDVAGDVLIGKQKFSLD
jgi:hypothetical protein